MSVVLYGRESDPKTWSITRTAHDTIAIDGNATFVKEFNDFFECRSWVLKEIDRRRKELGRLIHVWQREPKARMAELHA